jgi:hypothetical protein
MYYFITDFDEDSLSDTDGGRKIIYIHKPKSPRKLQKDIVKKQRTHCTKSKTRE